MAISFSPDGMSSSGSRFRPCMIDRVIPIREGQRDRSAGYTKAFNAAEGDNPAFMRSGRIPVSSAAPATLALPPVSGTTRIGGSRARNTIRAVMNAAPRAPADPINATMICVLCGLGSRATSTSLSPHSATSILCKSMTTIFDGPCAPGSPSLRPGWHQVPRFPSPALFEPIGAEARLRFNSSVRAAA
jgi:hypothetical protein